MVRLSAVLLVVSLVLTLMFCKPNNDPNDIVLTSKNFINLRAVINKESVDAALKGLAHLNKVNPAGPNYIVIESPGGYVTEGNRFIKEAKKYKNLHTITIFAASMASAIVEALPGKRFIIPNGVMMFHRGGYVKMVTELLPLEIANSSRIGISLDKYRMNVLREWWLKGEENLRQNVSDKIVNISCDSSLDKAVDTFLIAQQFMGVSLPPYKAELSKCPLVVQPIM